MKCIGIIGAMDEEISILKSNLEIISAKNIVGVDFYMGKMSGKNVVIVHSGIGKVNAAICTQILIDLYAVDYIINIGVAGAISNELEVGDIVISNELLYHDFDTTAFGSDLGVIPRMNTSIFKADEILIELAKEAASKVVTSNKVYVNRICTGDQFISSKEEKLKLWNTFKAYCTEMEGAAIAHTCFLNKIPFVVIRTASDKSDDKANSSYSANLEDMAKCSSSIAQEMINNI